MMRLLVGRGERTLSTPSSVLLGLTQAVDSGVPLVVAVSEQGQLIMDEWSAGGPEYRVRFACTYAPLSRSLLLRLTKYTPGAKGQAGGSSVMFTCIQGRSSIFVFGLQVQRLISTAILTLGRAGVGRAVGVRDGNREGALVGICKKAALKYTHNNHH
jgi:hypothetical protein